MTAPRLTGSIDIVARTPNTAVAARVVIAGGGVAGLEGALALRDHAGERVTIELVAPSLNFVYRPATVLEPFGEVLAPQFAISEILRDSEIHHLLDSVAWVDRERREAHTSGGQVIRYDALLLCPGVRARASFAQAITISGASQDPALVALVADLDAGAIQRLAFVVPAPGSWQLPLYELALLTAERARERGLAISLSIFTSEPAPLEAFGERVGNLARTLLADAGIELTCGAVCRVPDRHSLLVDDARSRRRPRARQERVLRFDRILALPRLHGPRIRGVPAVRDGFIPVDTHGRILGSRVEFAAGDATNCPVKHGSVAAQQADAAAQTIASLAGAQVNPAPCHPVATGILPAGTKCRRVSASIVGGHSLRSKIWSPSAIPEEKIDALYLAPRLAALREAGAPV
jgi:sulfide:quinone oxidoreductase